MEIYFDSENAILKIKWLKDNSCLATAEYIDYWNSILKHVEVLRPALLLIDNEQLEYREVPDIQEIFNKISELIQSKNMAIIESNNTLGLHAINCLIKQCPQKEINLFNNRKCAEVWLLSKHSVSY